MDKVRKIINDYKDKFPEFQYYHDIIDKIEENIYKMPDVSIESCKSLIEGISKTILNKLKISYTDEGRNAEKPRDFLKKVLDNIFFSASDDPEFITRVCELVVRMTEIRNKRGDISHGRLSPKVIESDTNLAIFISEITNSTLYYLLNIYFNADHTSLEEIRYEDNLEFNEFLDSGSEFFGLSYSKALFDQDSTSYELQLKDYLLDKEVSL